MSELMNQLGMTVVGSAVLKLEWYFRPQETSDRGIDAHAEKAPGDRATGRLLALQVKSGPSYFKSPTENGWMFRFDAKKYALWLNHALPVLVVLVDVHNEIAYWQRISTETIVPAGKSWKVEVPRSQTIATADAEWSHIASGLESKAINRYDFAISQLPPSVQDIIASRTTNEHADAAILALHLAEGRDNPRGTLQALLAMSPGWITRNGPKAWKAIAAYAAEHDQLDLSTEAFERAAAVTPDNAGTLLAAAAVNILPTDRSRAEKLQHQADATGQVPLPVAVIKALLAHPADDAGPRQVPPIIAVDNEAVRSSQLVQMFLADHASRCNDLDGAIRHARLALDTSPQDSSLMVVLAQAHTRRSGSARRRADDASTAAALLQRALDQRHEWHGPTADIVLALMQAYAAAGQFDLMLRNCLPPPQGTATAAEAEHPHIRRHALYAAHFASRRDLVDNLAARLGDTVQDRVAKQRVGVIDLTPDQQRDLLAEDLTRAVAENDYENIVTSVVALASLGQDERSQLAPYVDRSIVPATFLDLSETLLTARTDLDAALPTFRSLARRDLISAEYFMLTMDAAGRYEEAAQACSSVYELTKNPRFLLQRAKYLIQTEAAGAEQAARDAVNSTPEFPTDRADLLTYLGTRAANRNEWDIAEHDLTEALRLRVKPTSLDVWRVVVVLLELGRLPHAAAIITEYNPAVETRADLDLWLKGNAAAMWDQAKASEALVLAQQFKDPQLSTALLHLIVTRTHSIDETIESSADDPDPEHGTDLTARQHLALSTVSAELHRQAFVALDELESEFGEQTGITIIRGGLEQQVTQMTAIMQQTAVSATSATVIRDLMNATLEARLPRGFAATFRSQGYATLLVRQSLGPLMSRSTDDAEHELDVATAARAIGQPVVIDAAAMLVLTGTSTSARFEGQFPQIQIPAAALRDVYRATADIRGLASSPGAMGWDEQLGSLYVQQYGNDEFVRQFRRAQALEHLVEGFAARTVDAEHGDFGELGRDAQHAAWLAPIQLAHARGIPLWSDDLGARRLAREFGVACFGTPALIDALRDRDLEYAAAADAQDKVLDQTAADNRALAADGVLDMVLHLDDLLQLAEADNWLPRAAGLALSRPSWWAWHATPMTDLLSLYEEVSIHRPESLGDWQYAAMYGAARAYQPADAAARILAVLALLAYGGNEPPDVVAECVQRARKVALEANIPDPITHIPAAAGSLGKAGKCQDPERTAAEVLAHVANLDDLPSKPEIDGTATSEPPEN